MVSDDKVFFVPNGADVDLFRPGPRDNAIRRELGWGDRLVVMYAGAHGRANALGQLVDADTLLRRIEGDFAPATWQAFLRHVLEGAPAPRVAEEMGLSLNSVFLAKSRVLKRLRQESAGFLDC